MTGAAPSTGRVTRPSTRGLVAAVLLCGLGASLVLGGVGRTWVRTEQRVMTPTDDRPDAFVLSTDERAGSDVAGGVRGLGLVALAGSAALVGTRGLARQLTGAVLVAAGAGTAAIAGRVLVDPDAVAAGGGVAAGAVGTTLAGALLVAVAGATAARGGSRWATLGVRYDADPDRLAPDAPRDELGEAWDAVERGDEPDPA